MNPYWPDELLFVFFERLGPSDWWRQNTAVDDMLRRRFADEWNALRHCPAPNFLSSRKRAFAAIVLFDQIPRNINRGTALAFVSDPLALELSEAFIARGWDRTLPDEQRQFAAMPLMHSENLRDQQASLRYFAKHLPQNLSFARGHHDAIARFGRFPHRNEVLGRTSTAREKQAVANGLAW